MRAIDKEIILRDPFKNFKGRKTKMIKKPLSMNFTPWKTCYTGLAYIDVYQLSKTEVKEGIDGKLWIISARQKTGSETNIQLLPQALQIIDRYKPPLCLQRGTILPESSNQKMNEYLKEIANLCGFPFTMNTHMARRTFGSTVTLNNNVPIHVVKEMLGHASVKQTEAYAITEQASIGREMAVLDKRLNKTRKRCPGRILPYWASWRKKYA